MQHQYQVAVQSDIVQGALTGESGQVSGEVADVSPDGGAVRLPASQDPSFFIGELVTFEVDCPMGSGSALATVNSRTELDRSRRFGLSFDAATLGLRLSSDLVRHFDARRRHRVQPETAVRVFLTVPRHDIRATGILQNVSASGMAVRIDTTDERHLTHVVDVDLQFRLPGNNHAFVFRSGIRYRRKDDRGDGVCIGLRFCPDHSPAFDVQQRSIAEYVMGR